MAAPLNHPRGNQPQPISDFFLLEYTRQHLSSFETAYALSVVVPDTVQPLLPLPDLPLKAFEGVHRSAVARYFRDEGLVSDAFERVVHLMALRVVAEEVASVTVTFTLMMTVDL